MTQSGRDRIEGDFYYTEPWATQELLKVFTPDLVTWECASGEGDLSEELQKRHRVISTDLHHYYAYEHKATSDVDFLKTPELPIHSPTVKTIITNPPYGPGGHLARKFCEHALALTKPVKGSVAMLMKVDFDSGSSRQHIFKDCPAFAGKLVLLDRLQLVKGPMTAQPMYNHAWYLWDWNREPWPSTIRYSGRKPKCKKST